MNRWTFGAALVASFGLLMGCGEDSGLNVAKTAQIELAPESFLFPKTTIGDSLTQSVEVRNVGTGELVIRGIDFNLATNGEFELTWADTENGDPKPGFSSDGKSQFSFPLRVPAEDSLFLNLTYSPGDEDFGDNGSIILDTIVGEKTIPVLISDGGAEINVNPGTLDFGRVPATDENIQDVTVTNVGLLNLNIQRVQLNGSQDFSPSIGGRDPRQAEEVLADPDGDGTPGLKPGASFVIKVKYAPLVEGPDSGELSIFSTDLNRPEVKVSLRANGATSCVDVTPPAVEFRTSLVNRTDSRPLSIESCGGEQLEVTAIYLSADSDPAFALDAESLPELPFNMPAVDPDSAPPSRTIRVAFTPREQRIYNGKLIIESNDPVSPVKVVSLLGRGVLNACPQARAAQDEFTVLPLDVVVLDGSLSIDSDGPNNKPVEYEWVITGRPNGSTSQPVESFFDNGAPADGGAQDDKLTPTSLFFVDLAGTYTAELRVRDNLGLDSTACENPAIVTIVAKPDEAIHIQLVWRTPADPDETDTQGADLDLHLLHPNAQGWFEAPYDAHYANPVPDWGQLENPADDPSLDIDDINGAGPENVNLDLPENTEALGAPYLVGVHYYSSHDRQTQFDYGPSFATVRVFINGELSWDHTADDGPGEREMEEEDHFWDVAQIEWPSGDVTTRDRYYRESPRAE